MPYPYSYDDEIRNYQPPKLNTDRKMWKLMLFNILTLGIYSIFFFMPFSFDLDKIAPKRDGTKTWSYAVAFVFALFTGSITMMFWQYQIAERIDEALSARGITYDFDTGDYWGWYFFGSFFFVGPFIYFHKLCTAMNLLCAHYNEDPTATF